MKITYFPTEMKVQPFVALHIPASRFSGIQGRENNFEVGGRQTSSGVQGNPYPKLKTPWIWFTIFWEGLKFTCKNKQK